MTALLLDVRDLRVSFPMANGMTEAVRGVSFSVAPGEAIGIVGESGSGKSVSALAVMRLVAQPGRITGGDAEKLNSSCSDSRVRRWTAGQFR